MNLNSGYMVMRPIQLPWMYATPSGLKGLDYHLSPDLFIRMEGILTGDKEFNISHIILALEGVEVNELQAEHIFLNEYLPAKSKERIAKAFKDEQVSCFFTVKHMEYLQKLFESQNFMSYDISVYYKDRKVEDIPTLPPKEFKLISQVFDDLDVLQKLSHKENRKEIEEKYEECYREKIAATEDQVKKNLWKQIQHTDLKKHIGKAVGSVAFGIAAVILQQMLTSRGGIISITAAFVVGTLGVFMELYGRNEAQNTLRQLQFEGRAERMAF
jgi:hypothetical protein